MEPDAAARRQMLEEAWNRAAFVADVGIRLRDLGKGWCESELLVLPRHLQQNGVVHAGVQATMADHTAGAAAWTMAEPGQFVLSIEFKISLLRAGRAERLLCRADVIKPGRSVSFVEAEVFALTGAERALISRVSASMSVQQGK